MPAPELDILVAPATQIQFDLEPAHSAFHSLLLVLKSEKISGLSGWVTDTLARMSAQEWHRHRLVLNGLYYAAAPQRSWPSFPAFIDYLDSLPPEGLQARLLERYSCCPHEDPEAFEPPNWPDVLASADNFLAFVAERFGSDHVDEDLEREAYTYIVNPPAMKAVIVSHLRHMWDTYLAEEWARNRTMLQDAIEAFAAVDYSQMSNQEVLEFVAGRQLDEEKWQQWMQKGEGLRFVPSAHIGPYVGITKIGDRVGIMFGARLPEGAEVSAPDLSRAEILIRLGALADDTRLQILQLIGQEGELRSQDIMDGLALSQSAASRHLSQLSANGFLSVRRCEGAKCYRLNTDRISNTLAAANGFLIGSARRQRYANGHAGF